MRGFLASSLGAVALALTLAILVAPSTDGASGEECFATCKYTDRQGNKYLGFASRGCSNACEAARKKCEAAGVGGCAIDGECRFTSC